MRTHKSYYFNNYTLFIKLILLLILCCIFVCCGKKHDKQDLSQEITYKVSKNAVNINLAGDRELMTIPHIGEKTARAIIEHRSKFGRFRKPEHLMLVPGISDRRFRKMREMIVVE